MPIVEYKVMEQEAVNPLKKIEVFPEAEMKKCVQNFNIGVKNDKKLVLSTKKSERYWRSKNTAYFCKLAFSEFKIVVGLLLAAMCCSESVINLWTDYRTDGDHYFNSPANLVGG